MSRAQSNLSPPVASERGILIDSLLIALLALIVRAGAFFAFRSSPFAAIPILDAELYDTWAREIAGGDWVGDDAFFANPLYPYFLAILYAAADGSAVVARVAQHAIGVITVVLVHRLGVRSGGRVAGAAAGMLAALYLPLVAFEDTLLIATLGAALWAAALVLALRADRVGGFAAWCVAGWVGGLGLVARPTLVPIAVVVWALLARGRLAVRLQSRVLPYVVGIAIAVLPVTARNVAVSGQLVWITAHGGETFYVGNRAGADGSNMQPDFVRSGPRFEHGDYRREASRRLGRQVDLATASRYWRGEAWRYIASQPGDWLALETKKLGLLAHAYEKGDNLDLDSRRTVIGYYRLPWPGFGLVATLGMLGIIAWLGVAPERWRERARAWLPRDFVVARTAATDRAALLLALTALAIAAGLLLYFVTARYRLPVVVPLLPFAGTGAVLLWQSARGRAVIPIILAVLVFAFLHRPLGAGARNDPSISATNLGFLYEKRGELDRAALSYRGAIEHDPSNALAHFNLGVALRKQGKFDDAARAFGGAITIAPDYADAWEQLGMTREQQGDLAVAVEHYERAIALDPARTLFYRDLARVFVLRGEPERAVSMLRRALAIDPADGRARARLDALTRELGR